MGSAPGLPCAGRTRHAFGEPPGRAADSRTRTLAWTRAPGTPTRDRHLRRPLSRSMPPGLAPVVRMYPHLRSLTRSGWWSQIVQSRRGRSATQPRLPPSPCFRARGWTCLRGRRVPSSRTPLPASCTRPWTSTAWPCSDPRATPAGCPAEPRHRNRSCRWARE